MMTTDILEHEEVDAPPVVAAQVPTRSATDPAAINEAMSRAFDALMTFLQQQQLATAGPPRATYTSYGPEGTTFTVAGPVGAQPAAPV
jgi:hypothetical protein